MVSGFLRALVVLLLFALHIDSKAVSLLRQKRAPNFHVSYKRFQHPRLGRKRAVDDDDTWSILNIADIDRANLDPKLKDQYIKLFMGMLNEALKNGEEVDQILARITGSNTGNVNFLHYPRAGRSNFFAYPRGGRSMPVPFPKPQDNDNTDVEDVCCTGLKASWISGQEPDVQQLLCKCCDGLTTRIVRQNINTYAVCAPIQKFDNSDEDTSL